MPLNGNLWNAILSMDSYNRGYGACIIAPELSDAIGIKIGNYSVSKTSSILGSNVDQSAGFYAISYSYDTEKIISYRGTDQPPHISNAISLRDLGCPPVWRHGKSFLKIQD